MSEVAYTPNPRPTNIQYPASREFDVCEEDSGPPALTCNTLAEDITGVTVGLFGNTENVRYFGQRFVASANETACRVVLRLARDTGVTGTLTVGIWSHNAAGSGTPNALVESKTLDIATLGTTEGDATLESFTTALVSGTTYWIVIDDPTNGGNFGGGVIWYMKTAAVGQTNMSVLSSDGAAWSEFDNNRQLKLQIYKLA